MAEPLLNTRQAATYLGYSRAQLYTLARQDRVPHFRVNGVIRFDQRELEAWLSANRRGPKAALAGAS